MAKKGARGRTSAKKMKDKWRAKEWYKLIAPEMFDSVVLGETLADEPSKIMGRSVEVTVHELTGDFSKMYMKMHFKVDELNGFNAHTKFVGHSMTSDYVRRLVRRKRSKVDTVFDVKTKDGYVLRLKPMGITDQRIQASQKATIRQIMANESAVFCSDHTMAEVMKGIIDATLQKNITKGCKSIYPVKKVEFGKSEIISEPDKKRLKELKTVKVDDEEVAAPEDEVKEENEGEASELTSIPGIGPQKAKVLIAAGFKTAQDIKNASPGDLEKAEGIGPALAKKIHEAAQSI